ncbi:MAG: hypothetical protein LBS86_00460 [Treponema sp.]|jgi:hypothetical protein|nr:hypothetical protein [Treponema sp.]
MRKAFAFVALCVLVASAVMAQEDDDEEPIGEAPIESDWSFLQAAYAHGDQTFTISAGVLFPTLFTGKSGVLTNNVHLGGTGSLAYAYFLTPHWYLGAELGFMFASTLAEKFLYIIPFGLRVGFQFVLGRFEFPIGIMVGGAPQKYLNEKEFFGFIAKGSASVFFRITPNWSFGLNGVWWWVPEWTPQPAKNAYGNFLELTLSARYHF